LIEFGPKALVNNSYFNIGQPLDDALDALINLSVMNIPKLEIRRNMAEADKEIMDGMNKIEKLIGKRVQITLDDVHSIAHLEKEYMNVIKFLKYGVQSFIRSFERVKGDIRSLFANYIQTIIISVNFHDTGNTKPIIQAQQSILKVQYPRKCIQSTIIIYSKELEDSITMIQNQFGYQQNPGLQPPPIVGGPGMQYPNMPPPNMPPHMPPPMYMQQPNMGMQPGMGMQQPNMGMQPNIGMQPNMGMQQPNMGMQQPNMGMQQPNMGMQQPNMGMQQPNMGMQQPNMGMQQPNMGMQYPQYPRRHNGFRKV
jgi:hypothetical protein